MVVSFRAFHSVKMDELRGRELGAHASDLESNPSILSRSHLSGLLREMNETLERQSHVCGSVPAIPTRVGAAYLRGWLRWEAA